MNMTITFEEMNLSDKLDTLSEMLADACFIVDCNTYHSMTPKQQAQVKEEFFSSLQNDNVEVTNEIIEAAEKEFIGSPMASFLRQYKYYTQGTFKQATEQLTHGRKVTVVKFSEFGFPVVFNTVIDSVVVEPYAQYSESLEIIHKPKRKRSLYSNRVLSKDSLLVYDGWLDIDIDNLVYNITKKGADVTVKRSKYSSFDKQFMQDIMNVNKGNLIVKLNV